MDGDIICFIFTILWALQYGIVPVVQDKACHGQTLNRQLIIYTCFPNGLSFDIVNNSDN
jgi:hypothetical protein